MPVLLTAMTLSGVFDEKRARGFAVTADVEFYTFRGGGGKEVYSQLYELARNAAASSQARAVVILGTSGKLGVAFPSHFAGMDCIRRHLATTVERDPNATVYFERIVRELVNMERERVCYSWLGQPHVAATVFWLFIFTAFFIVQRFR